MAAIGEIVRVALHYQQAGAGDMMNVFHFRIAGNAPSDTDLLDDIVDWALSGWGTAWKNVAVTGCELEYVDCDIVMPDGTVVRNIGSDLLNVVGIVGGDLLPAAVSARLQAYTTVPKARGSKYVPGIGEPQQAGGDWSVGALANLAVLLGIYLSPHVGASSVILEPGLISRTLVQFLPFLVTGLIDTQPAYQRRRKAGVGI